MTTTPAELAAQITTLLQQWNAREAEMRGWMAGAIDGGDNGDGKFPLTDASGRSYLAPSLLKLADMVEGPAGLSLQAQLLSEAARDAAVTHRNSAGVHASTATSARTDAIAAKDLAFLYKNQAYDSMMLVSADKLSIETTIGEADGQIVLIEAIADDMLDWRDQAEASAVSAAASAASAAAAAQFDPTDFAPAVHSHPMSDITGLSLALDGKQPAGDYALTAHSHVLSDVTGLVDALAGKQPSGSYAAAVHSHTIGDVMGLQGALDGKQPAGSYQAAGSYAASVHTHALGDVVGLVDALAGKQPAGAYITASDVTWGALLGKPATFTPSAHTHAQADVTGLVTALAAKAPAFLNQLSVSVATTISDTHNNALLKLTGGTGYALTAGTPTAGMSVIVSNRSTATWSLGIAGGCYKNGATSTVTSINLSAGAHITLVHEGSGVWTADGTGMGA